MNKLLGLNRLWIFLAAALFCLTFAAPKSSAQQIVIGAGVDDPCYDGSATTKATSNNGSWCGILNPEVNVILDDSFNWYQNTTNNTEIVSPLVLVFAVPVQNLLQPFDALFVGDQSSLTNPDLTMNPIIDKDGNLLNNDINPFDDLRRQSEFVSSADLPCWFDCSGVINNGSGPWVDVDFPGSPVQITYGEFAPNVTVPLGWAGTGFTQGTVFKLGATGYDGVTPAAGNTDIYEWLGLPQCDKNTDPFCGPQSNNITNWTNATVEIPATVLGQPASSPPFVTPTEGWKIYMLTIDAATLMGQKDAIQFYFDENKLPLGTWIAAWAVGATKCADGTLTSCDPNYFSMSFTESAFLMPLPEFQVPEPTSLLLLGVGLAMVAGFNRKRGGKRN